MTISRAEAELARIEADIGRWEARIVEARGRAVELQHYIKVYREYEPQEGAAPETPQAPLPTEATRPRTGANTVQIEEGAFEILRERGRGTRLPIRDLVDALLRRGIPINSPHQVPYVSNVLSRSDRFDNQRPQGWGLTEQPAAQAPTAETFNEAGTEAPPSVEGIPQESLWRQAAE